MPPVVSSSKAISRLISHRAYCLYTGNCFGSPARWSEPQRELESFMQSRCSYGFAYRSNRITNNLVYGCGKGIDSSLGNLHYKNQTRSFLGWGDGEEGDSLSKQHEEKRVIGYSPEQLYAVVAAVDLYEDFLPWCQRSRILRHNNDGSFDAELQIGFKFFVESYMSHVQLKKPRYIKTTASESVLFDHLVNIWKFNPGPIPGTCDLHFFVDFKFQSPLYRQVASMFFTEVVSQLVNSFNDRCRRIYGPAVQMLERPYKQSA